MFSAMAAPEYVPVKPMDDVRSYESPPRRPDPWRADRPGDLTSGQPQGDGFGWQGPDQGFVLLLARSLRGQLLLKDNEHEDDVIAGAVSIALRRASLFGRAPVIHDLRVALTIWGYLDREPPVELVLLRRRLFTAAAHGDHYKQRQRISDAVTEDALRMSPSAVVEAHGKDWRTLLRLDDLSAPASATR